LELSVIYSIAYYSRAAAFNTRCNLSVIVFGALAKTTLQ